jgi:hypothetical protein
MTGYYIEEISCGLSEGVRPEFAWRDLGKPRKPPSIWLDSGLISCPSKYEMDVLTTQL